MNEWLREIEKISWIDASQTYIQVDESGFKEYPLKHGTPPILICMTDRRIMTLHEEGQTCRIRTQRMTL